MAQRLARKDAAAIARIMFLARLRAQQEAQQRAAGTEPPAEDPARVWGR